MRSIARMLRPYVAACRSPATPRRAHSATSAWYCVSVASNGSVSAGSSSAMLLSARSSASACVFGTTSVAPTERIRCIAT